MYQRRPWANERPHVWGHPRIPHEELHIWCTVGDRLHGEWRWGKNKYISSIPGEWAGLIESECVSTRIMYAWIVCEGEGVEGGLKGMSETVDLFKSQQQVRCGRGCLWIWRWITDVLINQNRMHTNVVLNKMYDEVIVMSLAVVMGVWGGRGAPWVVCVRAVMLLAPSWWT